MVVSPASPGKPGHHQADVVANAISPGDLDVSEDDVSMLTAPTQAHQGDSPTPSNGNNAARPNHRRTRSTNTSGSVGSLDMSSGALAQRHVDWSFSQVFGERSPGEDVMEADLISAVQFDQTGDFLATGDHGGRVVVFERMGIDGGLEKNGGMSEPSADVRHIPHNDEYEYKYLTEFQSHDPEFDYLKSLEIEEKINKIRWVNQWGDRRSHTLLTTNDKTIKLWKVYERKVNQLVDYCDSGNAPGLRLPGVGATHYHLASRCRKVYPAGHAYHINSISLCSDQETFLSADDLRINLWHFDRPSLSFNIVYIKPEVMEDLTEVITCATFHPTAPHILAYGSSKGLTRLGDMRAAALCDSHTKLFSGYESDPAERSFFSEIVASVNDVKFIGNEGNQILTRDYLTMKIWDMRYEAAPIHVHEVHGMLKDRLTQLYESDVIFDKFDCCASGDGSMLATGTYSNFFRVSHADPLLGHSQILEGSRDPHRRRLASQSKFPNRIVGFGRPIQRSSSRNSLAAKKNEPKPEPPVTDFINKIAHLDWHPAANVVAAVGIELDRRALARTLTLTRATRFARSPGRSKLAVLLQGNRNMTCDDVTCDGCSSTSFTRSASHDINASPTQSSPILSFDTSAYFF